MTEDRKTLSNYATGLLAYGATAFDDAREVERRFERIRDKLPARVRRGLAGRYDTSRPAMVEARRIAMLTKGLWLFSGDMGTGKTFAAALVLLHGGGECLQQSTLATLTPVQHEHFATNVSRLLIDELAGPGFGPIVKDRALDLVKRRHENDLQTLITTNLSQHDLALALEDAEPQRSRVLECMRGDGGWFTFEGPSLRDGQELEAGMLQAARELLACEDVMKQVARGELLCQGAPHYDPDPSDHGRCLALHEPEAIATMAKLQARLGATRDEVLEAAQEAAEGKARMHAMFEAAAEHFRRRRFGGDA